MISNSRIIITKRGKMIEEPTPEKLMIDKSLERILEQSKLISEFHAASNKQL